MHVVQMLLPLTTNHGAALPRSLFLQVQRELTGRFHGLTAYSRTPAEGLWKPRTGTKRDEIVVYEVMVASFDARWWRRYRTRLEKMFQQESIVIRAQRTTLV